MKTSLIFLISLPLVLLAQKSVELDLPRKAADSIVAHFLGGEIFRRHVKFETAKSKNTAPGATLFQYNFTHPKFSGRSLAISFVLDSTGTFVPSNETYGIIRIDSVSDSKWISAQEALRICRDQGHRIKKKSLRLEWDSTSVSYHVFQDTNDFRDINPGHLVWQVEGEVLFRGDRYSGYFEVNVFTGRVTRRFAIPWD